MILTLNRHLRLRRVQQRRGRVRALRRRQPQQHALHGVQHGARVDLGVRRALRRHLGPHVRLAEGVKGYGPVEFLVPEGLVGEVVAFGTDAPFLRSWGTPLLCGPGSILDAHTDGEKVSVGELEEAVGRHVETVTGLLARSDAEA